MHEDLRGRVAVVTGGGRGLGLEIGTALAEQGASVALLDLSETTADVAAQLAENTGVPTLGLACDVTNSDSLSQVFRQITDRLGQPALLVNAAGISIWGDGETMPVDQWRKIIDVNLTGTFLACQAFAQSVFAGHTAGTIVNVSSMSAFVVNTPQHQSAYNASKAGVDQLTRSLAVEWISRRIRVNAVSPGYFLSDMTRQFIDSNPDLGNSWKARIPAGRMGEPVDLRGPVSFLASDDSRYIVGESLVVDGGYSIV